jgi:hypothetical protein
MVESVFHPEDESRISVIPYVGSRLKSKARLTPNNELPDRVLKGPRQKLFRGLLTLNRKLHTDNTTVKLVQVGNVGRGRTYFVSAQVQSSAL